MVYVTTGGKLKVLNDNNPQVHGCSNYGSGIVASQDGKRKPSKLELEVSLNFI
jgi:hypothetical protein